MQGYGVNKRNPTPQNPPFDPAKAQTYSAAPFPQHKQLWRSLLLPSHVRRGSPTVQMDGGKRPSQPLMAVVAGQSNGLLFLINSISKCRFLVDTGAEISVMPATGLDTRTKPPGPPLLAANGSSIRTYGTHTLSSFRIQHLLLEVHHRWCDSSPSRCRLPTIQLTPGRPEREETGWRNHPPIYTTGSGHRHVPRSSLGCHLQSRQPIWQIASGVSWHHNTTLCILPSKPDVTGRNLDLGETSRYCHVHCIYKNCDVCGDINFLGCES